jgi:hypothetical protein
MIRAGTMEELHYDPSAWVFADIGFAQRNASCGLVDGDGGPMEILFSELGVKLAQLAAATGSHGRPLNLVVEAPLSVAFNVDGNPTGRSFESRRIGGRTETRYWYVGLGCCVLVAATYIMRKMVEAEPQGEIRLFEGFASFKAKGKQSSHASDVCRLRQVVRDYPNCKTGTIVSPDDLRCLPNDRIESAFAVGNMDFGVPPVVVLNT